jgi:SM-20-related protein
MTDLLHIPALLTPQCCADWRGQLDLAAGTPAAVLDPNYGGRVAPEIRRVARLQPPQVLQSQAIQLLLSLQARLQAHFGQQLGRCEAPQFLRYETGDFFVAHQDGNTPLLRDASLSRRVSLVLLLNDASEQPGDDGYGGGELVFHPPYGSSNAPSRHTPAAGSLIAFRAETTHEVLPVTHGRRYSIASWFHAAPSD